MPLQSTSGAASYDGFGGGVVAEPNYIESCFSTYLYTGNGSTQTITNGIDITGKGALVWLKQRNSTGYHILTDTARGAGLNLSSNDTIAQYNDGQPTFNSNGFNLINNNPDYNASGSTYASWTFRRQPKFFDIVTYTGTGSLRTISHNLGSVPGCIIIKCRNAAGYNWVVYHAGIGNTQALFLQDTQATSTSSVFWNNTSPTSTEFTVNTNSSVNASGNTFVAYLFAHNAGGFGLTGTDNVISCGSWTQTGSGATVNLGYEPQWILLKSSSGANNWRIVDNMRGMTASNTDQVLVPNASDAETAEAGIIPTATGFNVGTYFGTSGDFIYIAIRRGPMKVPTSGASVFTPIARAGTGSNTTTSTPFPVDLAHVRGRTNTSSPPWFDRLRGGNRVLYPTITLEETAAGSTILQTNAWDTQSGVKLGTTGPSSNASGDTYVDYYWRRAPSYMDIVCWSGNDAAPRNITHNLTVVPEMMIVKNRTSADTSWIVYHKNLTSALYLLQLETTAAQQSGSNAWRSTAPTASVFTVGNDSWVNQSGSNYVNYLFATCAGVQYINSYVGDGTTGRTINCGFTGGARFVCIKATSTTGSWWTFDSARGIVTNNDPALQLNSNAAEVTSADAIDTASSGFIVNQEATCSLNASGVTYLVWAIA